jgi:hypothetical protein
MKTKKVKNYDQAVATLIVLTLIALSFAVGYFLNQ